MNNKRLLSILIFITLILLIPFTANYVSDEVSWGLIDFIVAGTLLIIGGTLFELIIRNVKQLNKRAIAITVLILIILLLWIELAVGIFGSPIAGS